MLCVCVCFLVIFRHFSPIFRGMGPGREFCDFPLFLPCGEASTLIFKIRSCITRTDLNNKALSADFSHIFKIRSCSTRSDLKNKSARFSGIFVFSPVNYSISKAQIFAENRRKPQIFAESRRFSQESGGGGFVPFSLSLLIPPCKGRVESQIYAGNCNLFWEH